jgi:hypothetical protein
MGGSAEPRPDRLSFDFAFRRWAMVASGLVEKPKVRSRE